MTRTVMVDKNDYEALRAALAIADKALGIIETASQSKKSMKGTAATARRRILEVLR